MCNFVQAGGARLPGVWIRAPPAGLAPSICCHSRRECDVTALAIAGSAHDVGVVRLDRSLVPDCGVVGRGGRALCSAVVTELTEDAHAPFFLHLHQKEHRARRLPQSQKPGNEYHHHHKANNVNNTSHVASSFLDALSLISVSNLAALFIDCSAVWDTRRQHLSRQRLVGTFRGIPTSGATRHE